MGLNPCVDWRLMLRTQMGGTIPGPFRRIFPIACIFKDIEARNLVESHDSLHAYVDYIVSY